MLSYFLGRTLLLWLKNEKTFAIHGKIRGSHRGPLFFSPDSPSIPHLRHISTIFWASCLSSLAIGQSSFASLDRGQSWPRLLSCQEGRGCALRASAGSVGKRGAGFRVQEHVFLGGSAWAGQFSVGQCMCAESESGPVGGVKGVFSGCSRAKSGS